VAAAAAQRLVARLADRGSAGQRPGGGAPGAPVRLAAASDGRVDAGLHRLVDIDRFPPGTDAALAPLLRPAVATAAFPRWRYQIYIDGHSSAWSGMFQRLATGSPVLRVATADGWRQWYDDRLVRGGP
jgi:hypothetical protein